MVGSVRPAIAIAAVPDPEGEGKGHRDAEDLPDVDYAAIDATLADRRPQSRTLHVRAAPAAVRRPAAPKRIR